jgi:hypothetical protein
MNLQRLRSVLGKGNQHLGDIVFWQLEAMARSLDGAGNALPGYVDTLAGIREAYAAHVKRWYAEEQRWPDRPFWCRRHARDHPDADDPSPPSRVRSLQEQLVSVGQHVMIRLPRSGPEGYSSGAP